MGFWKRVRLSLDMIKFEHSVFALPFALTGALLAAREGGLAPGELGRKLALIVVAMVGARSAAMAFNRIVDAGIDGRNPRTSKRHLPGRRAFARLRLGIGGRFGAGLPAGGARAQPAVLPAGARGAGAGLLLLLHQALHVVLAPGAGLRAGRGAGGGVDRDARLARPAHPVAHRRGHAVDRRLRHHLLLPGLRIRRARGPLQPAPAAGHRRRAAPPRASCTP